jgi:hypothetical protein
LVEACSDKEKQQQIFGETMNFPPEPGNPWKFGKPGMGKLSPNNSQLPAAISRKTNTNALTPLTLIRFPLPSRERARVRGIKVE